MDRRLFFLFAVFALLSACGNSNGEPLQSANEPPKHSSEANPKESKYSPNRTTWKSDPDYKGELMGNPNKQVPDQCVYVMPNPRTHLIDHFIDNTPPIHIPLNSWKYDFIAGELALDVLDLEEAKVMFTMAQVEAEKEAPEERKRDLALCKMRLAYIARKSGDLKAAESLYKESLQDLKSASAENQKAIEISLEELALISWKESRFADAENYLRQRVALIEAISGPIGPALAPAQNDLANTLYYQNKLDEAGKLYKQCLLVAERFTDNMNHTLQAASNMANCRMLEHKYADALELYGRLHNTNKVNIYIQHCQEALSAMPASASKASDLPPPIGDVNVAQQLIQAAKINLAHDNSWQANAILKAAQKEADAAASASLKAEINIVEGDVEFAAGNYAQAGKLYQKALTYSTKQTGEGAESAASAQAKMMLCQIASKDESNAKSTFAELQKNKSKNIWKEITVNIQTMHEKHRLYFEKDSSSLLLSICKFCVDKTDSNTMCKAVALANLARAYQQTNDITQAESAFAQAREIANKAKDKNLDQSMSINRDLAVLYMQNKQFKSAETVLLEMLTYREKNPGQNNRNLIETLQLLSSLYSNWQRPDKEEFYYRRALSLRPAASPSFRVREKIADLSNLAAMSSKQCDYTKTEALLEEAIKLQSDKRENESINRELISIYQRSGQYEKLQNLQENIAQSSQISQSPADRTTMQTLYAASQAAFKCGNYDAAAKLVQQVITAMEQNSETKDKFYGCYYDEPRYTSCLFLLANCIIDGERNYDKAIVVLDKCINSRTGGTTSPGISPIGRGPAIISGPLPLTDEQLVDLLICTDAIGNKKRADEYRKQLKDKIEQFNTRVAKDRKNPASDRVIALIEKTKRSPDEDIEFMELLPQSMHIEGSYSGQPDASNTLERAIVLREHSNSKESKDKVADDYARLMQIYLDGRNFEAAEPLAVRRLEWLKKQQANAKEISIAKIEYAEVQKERGYFPASRDIYKSQLEHLSQFNETVQYKTYCNLAAVSEFLQEYDDELRYLTAALKLAPPASASWRQTNAQIATINDILGNHAEAMTLYKKALTGASEAYQVLEPLRQAADRAAQNKQYVLGEFLYRRIIELQSLAGSQTAGAAGAYMQLARMYRWAEMRAKSRAAYEEAIAYCKSHPAEQYQLATAEQELASLLNQH